MNGVSVRRAHSLAFLLGPSLVGRKVLTERVGSWPGGTATVIELSPDPEAPEIAFQVRHDTAIDPEKPGHLWEIGMFEHELVELL